MDIKEIIKKISSLGVLMHVAGVIAAFVGFILIVVFCATLYTHHGEKITVPDVRKHSEENATRVLQNLGFEVQVLDTIYNPKLKPGTVTEQSPLPGAICKSGRIIYLTINAYDVPVLVVPDLIDNSSYRDARVKLESMGFKVGQPEYVPGEKEWVYGMKVRGRNLSAGDEVTVDDIVIIQVGSGRLDASDTTIVQTYVRNSPQSYENYGGGGASEGASDDFEEIIEE